MSATPEPELVVVADAAAVATEAARRIVALSEEGAPFTLVLAGGSTPKATYHLLSGALAERVAWSRCSLYFGDERCVPPDHADSNYRMVKESLLDPLAQRGLVPHLVERMEGERDPGDAAQRYAAKLPPALDLVLLGMGADGHTASLFPETSALAERAPVAANYVAKLDTHRLTLTYPTLSAAKRTLVLVAGAEKAGVLAVAVSGPPGAVPLRDLRPAAGITFICDRAAAKNL